MTSPISVAFDLTPVISGNTGVARYGRELAAALDAGGVRVHRFALGRAVEEVPDGTRHLRVPLRVLHPLWRVSGRPRVESLTGPVDVVHSLDLTPPPTRRPLVVTVHDLVAVEQPHLHPARAVAQQRAQLAGLSRAAAILADSRSTADALAGHGIDPATVEVVHPGVTALPEPQEVDGVPPCPFVLAVGGLHPRKGLDVLLRAMADARLRDVAVVLAGPDAGARSHLEGLARSLGVAGRVHVLGAVSDAGLAWLYGHATVLAFPSRAEGFGFPVVEAMTAGLPVVASDLAVLEEVAGDGAAYFAAGDPVALANVLADLVGDPAARADLARRGRQQATRYRWDRAAADVAAVYARLCR